MSCQETRELIHGYVDREVDLMTSLQIEEHLIVCDACTQTYKGIRSLRSALSDSALRFDPPGGLEKRLRSALRQESKTGRTPAIQRWQWIMAAAALVGLVSIVSIIAVLFARPSDGDVLAQEIVSSHVRSLLANHVIDVESSNQHTVKPWFNGKLDFSPPVKDLSQQGFDLRGGRLDYIRNRPVAALVYKRREHLINVFIWPSAGAPDIGDKASVHQGYNVISWTRGGMTYWAVSDINLAELQQFVQLLEA